MRVVYFLLNENPKPQQQLTLCRGLDVCGGFAFFLPKNYEFQPICLKVTEGGQNLRMKTRFNSSQVFSKSDEVLPNHHLAAPDYWKMRSDDTELTNEKGSDLEDECSSEMDETAKIFKIEIRDTLV
ncbi:hypothetical protein Tco_0303435 [Tanacetum coccineum]